MHKQIRKFFACLLFLVLTATFSHAATKGRIMTDGKVSLYKNGKVVTSFTKEGPVDDSALIACEGKCLVKVKGLSLIADDQTRFAVKEIGNSVNLYVENGIVNFAVSDVSRQFAFFTPDGNYVQSEGFITPASTNKSTKGYMRTTDKGTEIGMTDGTMIVQSNKGTETIGPGKAILLALAPPTNPGGGDSQNNNKTKDKDDDDKKGAGFFTNGSNTQLKDILIVAGAGGAALITAELIADRKKKGSEN